MGSVATIANDAFAIGTGTVDAVTFESIDARALITRADDPSSYGRTTGVNTASVNFDASVAHVCTNDIGTGFAITDEMLIARTIK